MLGIALALWLLTDLALPPLEAAALLPDADDLRVLLNCNALYRCDLDDFLRQFGPYAQALDAQQETIDLGYLYSRMWEAKTGLAPARVRFFRYLTALERRVHLWHILQAAGPDALATGDWPPPIPLWRFVCVP